MTTRRPTWIALTAVIAFAGCSGTIGGGGDAEDLDVPPFVELAGVVREVVQERAERQEASEFDPATSIGPAELAQFETRTWFANIPDREAWGSLTQVADNRGTITYFTRDGISVSMRRGVIVATRGLGEDLLGTSPRRVLSHLSSGSAGDYSRRLVFLDRTSDRDSLLLDCQFRPVGPEIITIARQQIPTLRYSETCFGAEEVVRNTFWLSAASGETVQASQWVSSDVGYLNTYLLRE